MVKILEARRIFGICADPDNVIVQLVTRIVFPIILPTVEFQGFERLKRLIVP